eukprot:1010596_1
MISKTIGILVLACLAVSVSAALDADDSDKLSAKFAGNRFIELDHKSGHTSSDDNNGNGGCKDCPCCKPLSKKLLNKQCDYKKLRWFLKDQVKGQICSSICLTESPFSKKDKPRFDIGCTCDKKLALFNNGVNEYSPIDLVEEFIGAEIRCTKKGWKIKTKDAIWPELMPFPLKGKKEQLLRCVDPKQVFNSVPMTYTP